MDTAENNSMQAIVSFILVLWLVASMAYSQPTDNKHSPVANKQQDAILANKRKAEQLCSLFAGVDNIKANIVQKITGSSKKNKTETGYFIFKRPHYFKWRVEEPYSQEIFVNDQETVTIDPDFKQVVINITSKQILGFSLFNNNSEDIEKEYTITVNNKNKQTIFHLIPKENNDLFESMTLTFISKKLHEISYRDILGNLTTLDLKKVVTNSKLKEDEFQPKIKKLVEEGYDIADYRQRK